MILLMLSPLLSPPVDPQGCAQDGTLGAYCGNSAANPHSSCLLFCK